jgi:hypothetical protein
MRVEAPTFFATFSIVAPPGIKCYLIRMLRALPDPIAANAGDSLQGSAAGQAPRLVPLQSRVTGTVYAPLCSTGGELLQAVR